MYLYFYDKLTQEKKYASVLARTESKLLELGISGHIQRLSLFKNARQLIEEGLKKGVETIVAVGDDHTFVRLVHVAASLPNVTIGFLPILPNSHYGKVLGMKQGDGAAVALSRRVCVSLDIAKANETFFLGSLDIEHKKTTLSIGCDAAYAIHSTDASNTIRIMNLGDVLSNADSPLYNTQDGLLDLVISPAAKRSVLGIRSEKDTCVETSIPVQTITVESSTLGVQAMADHTTPVALPCTVTVHPKPIKVIVGPDRLLGS